MRSSLPVTLMAIVAVVVLVGCGGDEPSLQPTPGSSPAARPSPTVADTTASPLGGAGVVELTATLTGAAAVPPGDPDGSGTALLTLDPATGEVCFTIEVEGVDAVTAAHIHEGSEGTSGGVVIGLAAPSGGSVQDCVSADSEVVALVTAAPDGYYVNVHSDDHPDGAVRGQLRMR